MTTKPTTKKENLRLKHVLSNEELHTMGAQLAGKTQRLAELENEKKAVMSEYKAQTDLLKSELALVSMKINNGYEMRNVACEVTYHSPNSGDKTVTRTDTGEHWFETMTTDEWNLFTQPHNDEEE